MKIGFIGLGIMGSRMAANLLKGGHTPLIWNRSAEKAHELTAAGALWVDSPQRLARQVDVLFSMLSKPEAVQAVALGENGFLEAMRPGSLWVDCSTVNPSFSKRMAAEAAQRQIRFMDAPVAGSKGPAENAQLLFLAGGAPSDLEEIRPLLDAMGRAVVHVGEQGMGSALKMVNNLLLAQAMLAFSEGLALGEALGLPREQVLDTVLGGAVAAPFLSGKRGKIETNDYEADFPLQWMQKDLQLAAQSGYEQGLALPLTNLAKEIYQLASRSGLAEEDFSAIYQFIHDPAGKKE